MEVKGGSEPSVVEESALSLVATTYSCAYDCWFVTDYHELVWLERIQKIWHTVNISSNHFRRTN